MRRKAFTRTAAAVGATAALVGVTMAQGEGLLRLAGMLGYLVVLPFLT
jgi:hypothetical protein